MNYQITFPADVSNIPPIRDLGFHVASLQGFSREEAEHVKSIIDELCSNAVEHGSQPGSQVLLEIFADQKKMKMICSDQGHGNKLQAKDIEAKAQQNVPMTTSRGRGLSMIVKSFASELDFRDRMGGGIIATAVVTKHS